MIKRNNLKVLPMSPNTCYPCLRSVHYLEEGEKDIKEAGGKILAAYALMGRYDFIYITEFPDQKSALQVLFRTAMKGRVAPETLVAIPLEEFLQSVKDA
jgi:uncharacterized protein with GYD domain